MKDVNVFFIESKLEIETDSNLAYQSLEKQLKENKLSYSIKRFAPSELPASSNSSLTLVFLENSSVPKNYIKNIIALGNMVQDFSILCGDIKPVTPTISNDAFTSQILEYCHSYNLAKYYKNLVCDITDEPDNFCPSYNIAVNSSVYNKIGGIAPMSSPRGFINNDRAFVLASSKYGKIVHSEFLNTSVHLSESDFSLKSISKYFYNQGFLAAMNINFKKMPHFERIWKQFVETPESLDHRVLGRLTFTSQKNSKGKKIFAEKLAMVKCSYQSGLFEGLSGTVL